MAALVNDLGTGSPNLTMKLTAWGGSWKDKYDLNYKSRPLRQPRRSFGERECLEGVGEDGRGRLVSSLRQSFSHRHKSQLPMLIGHDNGVGAQRFAGFNCIGPGVPRDL
jgi:hypothetical protein